MSTILPRKLSHELANQLGIVASYAELLLEELGEANPYYRDIEAINQASHQLIKLFAGVASVEDVRPAARQQYAERMAVLRGACTTLQANTSPDTQLAADVVEMIKAADAVASLVPIRETRP